MAESISKEALTTRLAVSRATMSASLDGMKTNTAGLQSQAEKLKEKLEVGRHLKTSIKKNSVSWISGALVIGFLISRIPRRKGREVVVGASKSKMVKETAGKQSVRTALLLGGLKIALDLAKPLLIKGLKSYATSKFAEGGFQVPRKKAPPVI